MDPADPVTPASPWQTRGSRTAYENPWLRVREDDVVRPDGRDGVYGVVEVRQDSVFVVAVTEDDAVVLVELFRYTLGRSSLELPGGGTEPGEDPLATARRELLEETGLVARRWHALGTMDALDGLCVAPEHVFLARGLTAAHGSEQAEEGITGVHLVPWPDLMAMIGDGRLRDGESIAALMYAALALGRLG